MPSSDILSQVKSMQIDKAVNIGKKAVSAAERAKGFAVALQSTNYWD